MRLHAPTEALGRFTRLHKRLKGHRKRPVYNACDDYISSPVSYDWMWRRTGTKTVKCPPYLFPWRGIDKTVRKRPHSRTSGTISRNRPIVEIYL